MDTTFLLFALLGFLAVVLGLEALYNLWASQRSAEARQIASRLSTLEDGYEAENPLEKTARRGRLGALERLLERSRSGRRLIAHVEAAGMASTASELLGIAAILGAIGLMVSLLMQRPLLVGLGVAAVLAALPWLQVARRRARRTELFDQQFPEALDLISRALRAGHALPSAIRMAGEELPQPIGAEFKRLAAETAYGIALQDALRGMAGRVPLPDIGFFVVAVVIQRETGGNMAELLDNIASLVRQRIKLRGQIRTLSAEGRLSGRVLAALPFGAALALNFVNPHHMEPLIHDPAGHTAVAIGLGMMGVGMLWMRRIVQIRV
jgi:tight adherence protein B